MVNKCYDATSYESCSCKRNLDDANLLYESFLKAKRGSSWKPSVQKYELNLLQELSQLQKDLSDIDNLKFDKQTEFIIHERGKVRKITSETIRDRVIKHALCDEYLMSDIRKYLAYDNGAGLKGKGIDFTRRRLVTHLTKFYRENKSNDGYILLLDFKKFYDNIDHKLLKDMFREYVDDNYAINLLDRIIYSSELHLTSELEVYDSLNLASGDVRIQKHLNIGDQVSQVAGLLYPTRFDNYIKIVKGIKYYGRYMDDSYIIHKDKMYLVNLLKDLQEYLKTCGVILNRDKCHIAKLSDTWTYLQTKYTLTNTGKVVRRISGKRLSVFRTKLKKVSTILNNSELEIYFKSWYHSQKQRLSRQQKDNLFKLYNKLREESNLC